MAAAGLKPLYLPRAQIPCDNHALVRKQTSCEDGCEDKYRVCKHVSCAQTLHSSIMCANKFLVRKDVSCDRRRKEHLVPVTQSLPHESISTSIFLPRYLQEQVYSCPSLSCARVNLSFSSFSPSHHDPLTFVTRLIHTCDVIHSHVFHVTGVKVI